MNVLVVLPTYNESQNIDRVLRRIRDSLDAATVLVVDDGSPDGTADIAETLGKELGNIEVMRRHEKSGLGSAYRAGFRWGLATRFRRLCGDGLRPLPRAGGAPGTRWGAVPKL